MWLPDKIAEQVAVLDAHPAAGMVYGRTQLWYSWDANAVRSDYFYDLGVAPDRLYPPLRLLPQLLENRVQSPTTCNALIRREAYEEAGGFETPFSGLYEDQVFFAKLYLRLGDLRLEPALGALPPPRGERAARAASPTPATTAIGARSSSGSRGMSPTSRSTRTAPRCSRRSSGGRGTRIAPPSRHDCGRSRRRLEPSPRASTATVSVIVAFRDAGAHLAQAIASVEAQEHDRFELILVDDGSTDASTGIARAAAERDPERIRYLDHPGHANLGKSSSRNAGLRAAHGDYVVFLDADDLLLPGKLTHQAAFLDADQRRRRHLRADVVLGRHRRVGPRPRERLSRLWVRWGATHEPPGLLVRFLEQPGSVPCLCALMGRREALLRLGGFDESLQDLYEDQTLIAKLACTAASASMPSPASAIASMRAPRRAARSARAPTTRGARTPPGAGTSSGSSATALNSRRRPPARSPPRSPAPHVRTDTRVRIASSDPRRTAGSSCGAALVVLMRPEPSPEPARR